MLPIKSKSNIEFGLLGIHREGIATHTMC